MRRKFECIESLDMATANTRMPLIPPPLHGRISTTMSRIQQLDPHVINRIAAGEVIERPASVVKELLENSVDALATRIEVDISTGGIDLIRISDNGEGMHPDDLLLSVTSHATSKIRSDEDLQKVATMGFRGEALASIASISRFRIRTRRLGLDTGRELQADGGDVNINRECGCPQGTVIEVHNLFFNTPARRKFLKKPSTEFGRISEQFSKIALANQRQTGVRTSGDAQSTGTHPAVLWQRPGRQAYSGRIKSHHRGGRRDSIVGFCGRSVV